MKRTKEEAEVTKNTIIDTALTEFMRKGFEESTLESIAEKAGVTRGAIYWHFKNKYDLFESLVEAKDLESINTFKEIYDLNISPLKKLRKFIDASMLPDIKDEKILKNYLKLKMELYNHYIKHGDKRNIGELFMNYLVSVIKDAIISGELKNDIDVNDTAYTIFCLMGGVIVRQYAGFEKYKSSKSMKKVVLDYIESFKQTKRMELIK